MIEALIAEIARIKDDADFMEKLRALTEGDREVLDRLAVYVAVTGIDSGRERPSGGLIPPARRRADPGTAGTSVADAGWRTCGAG